MIPLNMWFLKVTLFYNIGVLSIFCCDLLHLIQKENLYSVCKANISDRKMKMTLENSDVVILEY